MPCNKFRALCRTPRRSTSASPASQTVDVKDVEDDIWLVPFMNYDFGYIDLDEKTLEPPWKTFGPKGNYVAGVFY